MVPSGWIATRFVEALTAASSNRPVGDRRTLGQDAGQRRLIHADLAGNVFVDKGGTPVVLDFTPAVRTVGFQTGVVIADLAWS